MKRGWGIALFCICFCALFLVCALWRGLTLRFYRLETDKLTEDARLRLVLLTDLHSAVYGEGHRELLDLVLDQRPDAILLGGDIVDDVAPLETPCPFSRPFPAPASPPTTSPATTTAGGRTLKMFWRRSRVTV